MRFGIQSGRSSRINAAAGTFDVGRRTDELLTFRRLLTVSKDEAFGNPRALRRTAGGARVCTLATATVDVATNAITNRKTSAGGSGNYTTPPPINTSAERKISQTTRPTQADLRGSGTTDKKRHLAVARPPTQGGFAQFGRFCLHNLTAARRTKGRLAQFCYTVKPTKTSTKKSPQVMRRLGVWTPIGYYYAFHNSKIIAGAPVLLLVSSRLKNSYTVLVTQLSQLHG
ncbi:Uncharacterized protein FWK35_00015671, partial [Aphis craccivora]